MSSIYVTIKMSNGVVLMNLVALKVEKDENIIQHAENLRDELADDLDFARESLKYEIYLNLPKRETAFSRATENAKFRIIAELTEEIDFYWIKIAVRRHFNDGESIRDLFKIYKFDHAQKIVMLKHINRINEKLGESWNGKN